MTDRQAILDWDADGNTRLVPGPPVNQRDKRTETQLDLGTLQADNQRMTWPKGQEGIRR